MTQRTVLLLCGGRSDEHEVSLASARSVMSALTQPSLNSGRADVSAIPIVIDRSGRLYSQEASQQLLNRPVAFSLPDMSRTLETFPTEDSLASNAIANMHADVVFPLLHGPYGEDGSVQGLLKLMGLPFVGANVLASALGMDKLAMKAAFFAAGLPQVAYQAVKRHDWRATPDEVVLRLEPLGYPMFVKPANLGSSVGVSKATNARSLRRALDLAARYDRRIIVEEAVNARELEVGILGNDDPAASPVGEICHNSSFYDYDTKYREGRASLQIPADVDKSVAAQCQALGIRAFQAIDASGLARVDFFYTDTGRVYVNEINTMPGFTQTSMYPKLWQAAGVSYRDLIVELVELALEAHSS
ncbi:MAG: D-alanine--D-alanine ligase family protein [Deinococcota bacterium]